MGDINDYASDVYRDSAVAGLPASGAHDPEKSDIRKLFGLVDQRVAAAIAGLTYYTTAAARDADTSKPIGTLSRVAGDATVYRYQGGSPPWVVDTAFYQGLLQVVQPSIDALTLGDRLPVLTTTGAYYYGVYSTQRLVNGNEPLVAMGDGVGGPVGVYGAKQKGVQAIQAQLARSTSVAARVVRWVDQLGSGRDLIQTGALQPAAQEGITTAGSVPIVVDGRRKNIGNPQPRGFAMSGWSLPARNNTRFIVLEPTASIASQLYERWTNSNGGSSDRNLFTESSDTGTLAPVQGGKLRYNDTAQAHVPVSPLVLTIRESATGTDIFFNDVKVPYGGAGPDGTLTAGYLGYGPESGLDTFNASARYLAYVATYGALSDADVLSVYKQLAARFSLDAENASRIVVIGDSISEGTQTNLTRNLFFYLRDAILYPVRTYNLGVSGNAQQWSYGNRAQVEGAIYRADRKCIAVIQSGINDIQALGTTGADLYNNTTKPYVSYLKGLGYKAVVCTLLPQTAVNPTVYEPQRTAYNNLVVANSAGADAIIDLAADPVMGAYPAAPNDTALFADKIHPTARGYSYLAPIYAAVLNRLLALP